MRRVDGGQQTRLRRNTSARYRHRGGDHGQQDQHLNLYQAVTSFPSQRDARDFINAQAQVWPHCQGFSYDMGHVSGTWPIIEVNHDGDTLNAKLRSTPGSARTQQRLLAVRGLVVIDITVIGLGADQVKTQAWPLLSKIRPAEETRRLVESPQGSPTTQRRI
ncbi:sensor domain-containing protein (plasmid) [Mycolicibacterium psychrotolerans]|uniref:sensor domain-containing protein n=1 Tax=Mycolicibacterium psychrotolerans TaxID=216929 RepID=UPI003D67B18F